MNRKCSTEASTSVRPPAVAGQFYPGNAGELRRLVESFLRTAATATGPAPKAIIAPHAGYVYSGPVAASAYARLIPARDVIRRVVLLGPAHFASFDGLAAPRHAAFATPLGIVPVDTDAVGDLCSRLRQVIFLDEAHAGEHALEVHLPFLQVVLAGFKIVPLLVGDADPDEIAEVIEALWDGGATRLVISSDLSHYHDYAGAQALDTATARAIEALRPADIGGDQACGRLPVCGLLRAARHHALRVRTLDLRNSGDTAGPRDRVVGYGAFAFTEAAAPD